MLPVTGYADSWSVRAGKTIRFMISTAGGRPFRARVARVLCGDPNPAGPGYRELPMPCALDGEHPGTEQPIRLGAWADMPRVDLGAAGDTLAVTVTIWPTLQLDRQQVVLHWQGEVAELWLGLQAGRAVASIMAGGVRTELACAAQLELRRWHELVLVIDPRTGSVRLETATHAPRVGAAGSEMAEAGLPGVAPRGAGQVAIGARRAEGGAVEHFNGKIERPAILSGASDPAAVARREGRLVADWDFSIGIPTDTVTDTGPGGFHGRLHNLPNRAATGSTWRRDTHRWTDASSEWGAIHFHETALGDAGWAPTLALDIPTDWPSGAYALHLEAEGGRDNIVFAVRARDPGRLARVALLLPTFTYQVYGNFVRPGRAEVVPARARAWSALPQTLDAHPEYGLSTYNRHADGSGVAYASMRRPMIDKRVNQFHLIDPSPGGSGTYWIAADTYLIDMMDRAGIGHEIITDHDLHAEGAALLSRYAVVLTGQHPEYHSTATLNAIAAYLDGGGRLMYMGGNGFYWKVVPHPDGPWALEIRRAEGGIRAWAAEPGEAHHSFDGSYGGLWRRLGRPPQVMVGVGFSAQGRYSGFPYSFTDAILNPRVAFMRDGLDAVASGSVFGERGLMGGGAAGHELDRADPLLGTPPHALVVASALVHDPSYQPVNEERLDHEWPGPREALIRSDVTFFETEGGGGVFSVGSMAFIGALPIDGYANTAARLVCNVIRRFAAPDPL